MASSNEKNTETNKTRKSKTSEIVLTHCEPLQSSEINELHTIIDNNQYIQLSTSNKNKDIHSLSYLITGVLSQSDCIKLGHGIEHFLRDVIIRKNVNISNVKTKNVKNQKEKDHLFANHTLKIIYYAEIKSNLNLDTEKCKATSDKCLRILQELSELYDGYTIKMFLVGARYYTRQLIPQNIYNKYKTIDTHLVGVNEYLHELDTNLCFDENSYVEIINYLANKMFSNS